MGSSFAPSVANLFMATLEERFILNSQHNAFFGSVFFFVRFIDDIFCLYTDLGTVLSFVKWLNEVHPSIKFAFTSSESQVNFLDTSIYKIESLCYNIIFRSGFATLVYHSDRTREVLPASCSFFFKCCQKRDHTALNYDKFQETRTRL